MLLTESKLRQIIKEEYEEIMKEAMYPRGGEDERGTHGKVDKSTEQLYKKIFAAIRDVVPRIKDMQSPEEIENFLSTAHNGVFLSDKKYMGQLQPAMRFEPSYKSFISVFKKVFPS